MNALRLKEGARTSRYALAGRALPRGRMDDLIAGGFLNEKGDRSSATAQGRMVLNAILRELLVD